MQYTVTIGDSTEHIVILCCAAGRSPVFFCVVLRVVAQCCVVYCCVQFFVVSYKLYRIGAFTLLYIVVQVLYSVLQCCTVL